jgi:predicted permease
MVAWILQFVNSFMVVLPIFLIIGAGYVLKRKLFIDEHFIDKVTRLVFWGCLPIMLFQKIAHSDFTKSFEIKVVVVCYVNIIFIFFISLLAAKILGLSKGGLGAFWQGSFRSNAAIVGLSVIVSTFPENSDEMLARAGIFMAFYIPILNVLAVLALLLPVRSQGTGRGLSSLGKQIILNPLIIGCGLGMVFSVFRLNLPGFMDKTLGFFSNMTLPLALLCVGGGLSFKSMRDQARLVAAANVIKLVLLPLCALIGLRMWGISGDMLVMVMIILCSPTAIASYVMARAMQADSRLAASIVMSSTVASLFSFTLWLTLLR